MGGQKNFIYSLRQDPFDWRVFKVFMGLLTLSLFLPLFVNEKPLLVGYKGRLYTPMLQDYTEQDFGGDLPIQMNFHERNTVCQIQQNGWVLWPIVPYGPWTVDYCLKHSGPQIPSKKHWMGTDVHGRDLLARLLYTVRFALCFSLILTILSAMLGVGIGALQGYFGGWVDIVLQRIVEVWFSVPLLFLLIAFSTLMPLNFSGMLCVMVLFKWRSMAPLSRMLFLKAREAPYVEAAYALGVPKYVLIFKHILPNVLYPMLARFPFLMLSGISILTTLDFFGFSLPFPMLSFGSLIVQGKNHLYAPWIILGSTGFLIMLLLMLVFLGEALQRRFALRGGIRG